MLAQVLGPNEFGASGYFQIYTKTGISHKSCLAETATTFPISRWRMLPFLIRLTLVKGLDLIRGETRCPHST